MKLSDVNVQIAGEDETFEEYDVRLEDSKATCFIASETGKVRD